MSLLRFSWTDKGLFAPTASGEFVEGAYSSASRTGKLGAFAEGGPAASDLEGLSTYLTDVRDTIAAHRPAGSPLIVMINGFQFDPTKGIDVPVEVANNPHRRILHFLDNDATRKHSHHAASWPLGLGLRDLDQGADGVGVAFGWFSGRKFWDAVKESGDNFYVDAYTLGTDAADVLAHVLGALRQQWGGPIMLVAHSLGTHVVRRTLEQLATHDVDTLSAVTRVALMGGAEFDRPYQALLAQMDALPGNPALPCFYNLCNTIDTVVDLLGENGTAELWKGWKCIGHLGLRQEHARWMDLRLNRDALRKWVKKHMGGLEIDGHRLFADEHWLYYTHPGNLEFQRRLLLGGAATAPASLRASPDPIPEGL